MPLAAVSRLFFEFAHHHAAILSLCLARVERKGNEIICVIVKSESSPSPSRIPPRRLRPPIRSSRKPQIRLLNCPPTVCLPAWYCPPSSQSLGPQTDGRTALPCHVCPSRHFTTLNGGEELKEKERERERGKRRFVSPSH